MRLPLTISVNSWTDVDTVQWSEAIRFGGPLIRLFRVSTILPLPDFEWAPDWRADIFTQDWRKVGRNRQSDWAIAMTNYGGLTLLDAKKKASEWDPGTSEWITRNRPIEEWIEEIMNEGEAMMAEFKE